MREFYIHLYELEQYHIDFLKDWNTRLSKNINFCAEKRNYHSKLKEYESAKYFSENIKEINSYQRIVNNIIKDYDNRVLIESPIQKEQKHIANYIDFLLDIEYDKKGGIEGTLNKDYLKMVKESYDIYSIKPLWYDLMEEERNND